MSEEDESSTAERESEVAGESSTPRWYYVVGAIVSVGGLLWGMASFFLREPAPTKPAAREVSILLRRAGTAADCPVLPASAQVQITPVQGRGHYRPLDVAPDCRAVLDVPSDGAGLVKLALKGAAPYELVRADAQYPLDATRWEADISDAPNMHLKISLFTFAGTCGNGQMFQAIINSKAQSLQSRFSITEHGIDHRYDYLAYVNAVATGLSASSMSPAEMQRFWEDNGSLLILSGLCVGQPSREVMRSSIFYGALAGSLPDPLVADLKVTGTEFGALRDIYSAAMLYALSKEAESRRLDSDIVIHYLGSAREIVRDIHSHAATTLRAAIDESLKRNRAPTDLPH